jgi:hypothetical protein
MSLVRCAGVLWAFAILVHPLCAPRQVLKDDHGEPLPPEPIGRLGSLEFRVAAPVVVARYLDGGNKLLVKTNDASYRTDGNFQLFDAQSGKELNRISWQESAEQRALWREDRGYYSYPEWCLSPDRQWLARGPYCHQDHYQVPVAGGGDRKNRVHNRRLQVFFPSPAIFAR